MAEVGQEKEKEQEQEKEQEKALDSDCTCHWDRGDVGLTPEVVEPARHTRLSMHTERAT